MELQKGLTWINDQRDVGLEMLIKWVKINSWSENPEGLLHILREVKNAFQPLGDHVEEIPLSNQKGHALIVKKNNTSNFKVLLGGHCDTVYPPSFDFPIQRSDSILKGPILKGPGVADMKGGLIALWMALSAFEKFFQKSKLGWIFICNPDEEIGSPGSRDIWLTQAKETNIALLFEPAFPDGSIVSKRKGSVTFLVKVKGKPAHVGRAFKEGRSAVVALSHFITKTNDSIKKFLDTTINFAYLEGGYALNIIPESASCKVNLRAFDEEILNRCFETIIDISHSLSQSLDVEIEIVKLSDKKPKFFDEKTMTRYEELKNCALKLNIILSFSESGGLSDGNIISHLIPTIDSLGVVGGYLHTKDEYMEIPSLVQRAQLIFLYLNALANQLGTT